MQRNNKFVLCLLLALLLTLVASAQTDSATESKPRNQKPGNISGIVTNSRTGEPLAHARVILRDEAEARGCSLWLGTCRYALTTADGRFSVYALAPGKYQMFVDRQGYRPILGDHEDAKPLELKSDEDITGIALQLVPDAVIAGRVLDEKGIPVARVSVEAVGGRSSLLALTNDHGEFRIGQLSAGRYLVKTVLLPLEFTPPEIRTDGTTEPNYGATYYPNSLNASSATPVEVRAGEETGGIEIRLTPAPLLHVSGTAPAPVAPYGCGDLVSLSSGPSERRSKPIRDRTFAFWRVPPGRYLLYAGNSPEGPPVEINITNASIEGIHLPCHEPLELTGQVEVEGGPVPDQKGGVLSLKFLPLGSLPYVEQSATINSDGTFKVTLPPGRYHVIANGLPQHFHVKTAHVGTTDLRNSIVDLRNIDPEAVMTVQLGANSTEITGMVRDVKGPVSGAHVALFFDDEYGFDVAATVTTASDGSYTLQGIAPGKYKLVAYDPKSSALVWSSDALALHAAEMENIDAREGDKIVQDLKLLP